MASSPTMLRRRALKIEQDPKHPLIVFSLTGPDLMKIAEISRVSRDDAGKLIGYQRPAVKKHIQDIVNYLNSDGILFPNSIILAMSSRAKFTSSRGPEVDDGCAVAGTIDIPLPSEGEVKPAWIVDGQQRTLALLKCNKPPDKSRLMHGAGIRSMGRLMDRSWLTFLLTIKKIR